MDVDNVHALPLGRPRPGAEW
eukprot:SAG11_NODE_24100_length_378_cov_0.741935_1_plen_20_part_10